MASRQSPSAPQSLDALAVLERDHRLLDRFFADFEKATPQQLDPIGRRICKMLRIHSQIEEELFYPSARDALKDSRLIDEAEADHQQVQDAISEVESRTSDTPDFQERVGELRSLVEAHVRREESEIFPRLRETELNVGMLALLLLDRRATLMDVMGLHSDDENSAAPGPARIGETEETNRDLRS